MKKKNILGTLSWLCAVLFLVSCSGSSDEEGPKLTVDQRFITLTATESVNIAITSNTSWQVSSDQNWLKYSPSGGSNNGSISIHAEDNTTGADRTTHLTIQATRANLTVDIQVTQRAKNTPNPTPDPTPTLTLSASPTSITLEATESVNVYVTSNTDWTVTANHSWLKYSPTSGSNNGTISIYADENTTGADRSTLLNIKTSNSDQSVSISVIQKAKNTPPPTLEITCSLQQ